jgi:D-alanyl-D-alanine carboxypeptidase
MVLGMTTSVEPGLRAVIWAACVLVSGGAVRAEERGAVGLKEAVGVIAGEWVESGKTAGLSIGVAKGDEVLLAEGYGSANLELSVPASADTVYRIGSVTKQFTAAAIMLLIEEGKVGLEDSMTKWLSDYPMQGHVVTVRQLLQHTSGIRSFTSLPSFPKELRRDMDREEMLARIRDEPFDFPPGERFQYNNSGYYLLGVIIEEASGKTYEEFLTERFFGPLEMEATMMGKWGRIISNRASGYSGWGGEFSNAPSVSMTQPFAAGALVSTVEDLMKWVHGLATGEVLSAESWETMTTRGALEDGKAIPYGCGVFVKRLAGRSAIRHGGGIKGFRSELIYFPKSGHTVVVLANMESVSANKIAEAVAEVVFGE